MDTQGQQLAGDPTPLAELIARAKQDIEAGNLEGGLTAFRRIAHENPDIPEVFNNLGAICAAMGEREEAERAFGRAAEITPEAANAWYNRGLMRFQSGNFLGARDDFAEAARLATDDAEVHNNLGVACFQLRDFPAAALAFERALELSPDYTAAELNLVDLEVATGSVDAAIARSRSLAQRTGEPEAQLKLIECAVHAATGQLEEAAQLCEDALESVPDGDEIRRTYGHIVRAVQALHGGPDPA